jgi:hypothetical protein
MSAVSPIEKRAYERLPASCFSLRISLNGHRVKTFFKVLDFNINGIAFTSQTCLNSNHKVRLLIEYDNMQVGPVEGALHNCRKLKSGEFRCGMQFRTDSPDQLDRQKIILGLKLLEDALRCDSEQ